MMRAAHLLLVCSGLFAAAACGGLIEEPTPTPTTPAQEADPGAPGATRTPTTPAPPSSGSPGSASGCSPTTSEAIDKTLPTCASLGLSLKPAATFNAEAGLMAPGSGKNFVDMYADESVGEMTLPNGEHVQTRTLRIVFTRTTRECEVRQSSYRPRYMSEEQIVISRADAKTTPAAIGTGTYFTSADKSAAEQVYNMVEGGQNCYTAEESCGVGTAVGGNDITGSVTITDRSASTLKGSMDLQRYDGSVERLTFDIPICAPTNHTTPSGGACCML